MSVWTRLTHEPVSETPRMRVIDLLLASRALLGSRCWGMLHLYYRAGFSHEEIAAVFGLSRQAVTHQFARALRVLLWALVRRRPEVAGFAPELTDEQRLRAVELLGTEFDDFDPGNPEQPVG